MYVCLTPYKVQRNKVSLSITFKKSQYLMTTLISSLINEGSLLLFYGISVLQYFRPTILRAYATSDL